MRALERLTAVAVVLHVLAVLGLLTAVAAGGELRLLLALGGGVLVTVGWVRFVRGQAEEIEAEPERTPSLPIPVVRRLAA